MIFAVHLFGTKTVLVQQQWKKKKKLAKNKGRIDCFLHMFSLSMYNTYIICRQAGMCMLYIFYLHMYAEGAHGSSNT